METNSEQVIIRLIAETFSPLKSILENVDEFESLMSTFGWNIDYIPTPMSDLLPEVNGLISLLEDNQNDIDYVAIMASMNTLIGSIYDLSNQNYDQYPELDDYFKQQFPDLLVSYLIINGIKVTYPRIYGILKTIGIFNINYITGNLERLSYIQYKISWNQFLSLITDPFNVLKDLYLWESDDFLKEDVLDNLRELYRSIGLIYSFEEIENEIAKNIEEDSNLPTDIPKNILNNIFYIKKTGSVFMFAGIGLYLLNKKNNELPGIALLPLANISLSEKIPIFDNVSVELQSSLSLLNGIALILRPNSKVKVLQNIYNSGGSSLQGEISFSIRNENQNGDSILLFGDKEGTNLSYKALNVTFGALVQPEKYNDLSIEIEFYQCEFTISPKGSDSFITNILNSTSLKSKIDFLIGYSSERGFYFNFGSGLEIKIADHVKIGPLELSSVLLSANVKDNKIPMLLTADLNVNLSAIEFTAQNIGLKAELAFPGNNNGNIGPIDFNLGFKPPTGVGLTIDAPPVKGGGFLNYDESTSTYTGGLELQFSKISFSAIGIISTKLPGGEKGYSLLVIVSVEFTPLQIGMGFTINGIGGLLGLHRTSNPDVLRAGIRYNTLDHILFPKNIVQNANTIISNLGQAFPARKDQFMLGPMAKIGWGTPTLLTIDIGIVIELPDPVRLIILGILRAQLPSAQNPILQIQVNFLGIIDFKEKYLSFDATLYDSKILTFGLFGDMALRLNWGDRPNFLLSVGGFHPSYTPPPLNLPSMQRLTIILADHSNLKISVESYFAVTSNSAQFGARVYAMAKAWKIIAEGELWFNVLFQFSPFYFAADMGVKFAIKMGSKTLLGIYVALMLEGPDPWRAQGQAAFKILLVKVKVRFDATFGRQRAEAIEAVKVDDKIKEALMLQDNWETLLPDQNNQMVAWRKEAETEVQSVDPSGAIKISQRVMPLNTVMQKFGSAAISDFNQYRINTNNVRIENMTVPAERVQDYFARSEFSNMTDEEKLSRDGYELFDSGVIVGSNENQFSQYAVHKQSTFEEITMDSGYRRKEEPKFAISDERLKIDSFRGYTTRTDLSRARLRTTSVGPAKIKLSISDGEFVLANRNNLQQVGGGISFANSMDAERYLQQQKTLSPSTVENWIIANRYELA